MHFQLLRSPNSLFIDLFSYASWFYQPLMIPINIDFNSTGIDQFMFPAYTAIFDVQSLSYSFCLVPYANLHYSFIPFRKQAQLYKTPKFCYNFVGRQEYSIK